MATPQTNLPAGNIQDALRALRERVTEHVADGSEFDGIRGHVRVLCDIARRDHVPPERLVIELKHTLNGLRGLDGLSPVERAELHTRLVQYAIRAYFADAE